VDLVYSQYYPLVYSFFVVLCERDGERERERERERENEREKREDERESALNSTAFSPHHLIHLIRNEAEN
jgi:hypothetical protein